MNERPQVSWKAIERDAVVLAADGAEAGKVVEVAGDSDADIFNGIVVTTGILDARHYLPAERVTGIWPDRVQVDATKAEIEELEEYEEPVAERLASREDLLTRLRGLFGRR